MQDLRKYKKTPTKTSPTSSLTPFTPTDEPTSFVRPKVKEPPKPETYTVITPAVPIVDPNYIQYVRNRQTNVAQQGFYDPFAAGQKKVPVVPQVSQELPPAQSALGAYPALHSSEVSLPHDMYGDRAVYGLYQNLPVQGVADWDVYYPTWDKVGQDYLTPIPPKQPLLDFQQDFMEMHGFHDWEEIGSGGFGRVFKVSADRLVVEDEKAIVKKYIPVIVSCKIMSLKQFKKDNRSPREVVTALLREFDLHNRLEHENIVKCEGVFHVLDRLSTFPQPIHVCHFMELCDGDLKSLIDEPPYRKMTENQAREWFVQVCKGLQYLHENNCCHLDIKPHNILYRLDTSNRRVFKLSDFGISLIFEAGQSATSTGRRGTPHYMAPEMARHTGRLIQLKPTDIYSLGITLAESISGRNKPGYPGSIRTHLQLLNASRTWNQQIGFQYRISQQFATLLSSMCNQMPFARKNIHQILAHPWVTRQGP